MGLTTRPKEVRLKAIREFFVVLQEGGSSGECYAEVYTSEREAKKAVAFHEKASYRATHLKVTMRGPVTLDQAGDISEAMANAAIEFARVHKEGHSFAATAFPSI